MKIEIKDFSYGDLVNFRSYIERHYLPMLDRLSEKDSVITGEDRQLLSFLHMDLTEIVNDAEEIS